MISLVSVDGKGSFGPAVGCCADALPFSTLSILLSLVAGAFSPFEGTAHSALDAIERFRRPDADVFDGVFES